MAELKGRGWLDEVRGDSIILASGSESNGSG